MILIDSSAWIEYYLPKGLAEIKKAVLLAIQENTAAVNGIIKVEILLFTSNKGDYKKLLSDFSSFHWFELKQDVFDLASEMGRELRRKGITIPATDLIIAACARANNTMLIHFDNHFEKIAQFYSLETISPVRKYKDS